MNGNGVRNSLRKAAAGLGLSCLAPGTAGAQVVDYVALERLFGEPVTTSVTGSPQRESDVPATMRIITEEAIRRSGARDIPGILRHFGLDVLRWTNEHADVAVRGYNEAFTPRLLVLVDGRQVYADYFGFTPWSAVPVELDAIHQIEVVKGPASALFGFNAVGGVINIVTADPSVEQQTRVSSSVGTQDLRQASAVTDFPLGGDAALRLSAGSRRSDPFSTPQQPADLGARRGNEREAVSAAARFAPGENLQLGFEVTYSGVEETQVPPTYSLSFHDYRTSSLRTDWAAETGIGLIQANLYRNSIDANAYIGDGTSPFLRFRNDVTVVQLQDIFKPASKHVVRVSAEYRDNSMATTPVEGGRVSYRVSSLGAMWSWNVNDAWALTNALRFDDWSLSRSGFFPEQLEQVWGLRDADWDRSLTRLSFNVGAVWQLNDAGTLRLMAARGQQLPNLLYLGGELGQFGGQYYSTTPFLDPSAVTHYEAAWERDFAGGPTLRLSAFADRTEDVQTRFFNIGTSRLTGAEASVEGRFGEGWRWNAMVTARDVNDSFPSGQPLAFTFTDFESTTPERVVNAGLGWSRGPWEVDGYIRHVSSFHAIRGVQPGEMSPRLVPIPSYAAVDGRIGYALTSRITAALSGRNLTDSSQRQTSAPEVERSVFATLSFEL